MKKKFLSFFVFAACFFVIGVGVRAETFTTSDLEGTWNGYTLQLDPITPAIYWLYGNLVIDNAGNITDGSLTTPTGPTVQITSGTAAISADGSLSGSTTASTGVTSTILNGIQDQSHTIFNYISAGTDDTVSMALGFKAGGTYVQADMEGDWRVYGIEIDAGQGLLYWVIGDAYVDSVGNMTASYRGPVGAAVSSTGGQISVGSNGKISGGFQFEGDVSVVLNDGMLDQGKTISSFVTSNNLNQLDFLVGLKKGTTYHPSDLQGDWKLYIFSIDSNSGAAFMLRADGTVDSENNLSGTVTAPDGSPIPITSGLVSLSTSGEVSSTLTYGGGITQTSDSGFMDENKTIFSFVSTSNNDVLAFGLAFRKSDPPPLYSHNYYLPYFVNNQSNATALAVCNASATQNADLISQVYRQDGSLLETTYSSYPPRGQGGYLIGRNLNAEGWLSVSSTQKLTGLSFIAALVTPGHMFDITFIPESKAAKILYIPHVAQNEIWDSTVFVNNPHCSAVTATLTFFDNDGVSAYSKGYNIPANGAIKVEVTELVQGTIENSGSIEISATKPVTAFGLYNDVVYGGKNVAGISAVDPNDQ